MKSKATPGVRRKHVCALAVVLLAAALAIGYLPPGTESPDSPAQFAGGRESLSSPGGETAERYALTPEQMKQLADRQAAPLIEKLQSDPDNRALLAEVGAIYHIARQYRQAVTFYDRAVQLDPGNIALRTKLATSLYRNGDADGAIAELNRALSHDANDANALFDLGVIRFEGKGDRKGAREAWKRLLDANPELSAERKATVEKRMDEASLTRVDRRRASRAGIQDNSGPVTH